MKNRGFLAATLLSGIVACGTGDSGAVSAAQSQPGAGQQGAPRGGGGGRGAATITLAASDVAVVQRGALEEGVPIAGDLHPIESVDVRSRLEGDLVGVYVREGQRVTAGQLLARFESSEQESGERSAEADRVAAQTELTTAQWNLEQSEQLFRAGAISEQDFKVSQQGVLAARARLAAAEARLKSSATVVRDTRVLSPTTGVISSRLVEGGEHVARGATMFTVVRSDVLELAAAVPARLANAVQVGQAVHFTADGQSVEGRVARVSPTIDAATRSLTVYAQIPNSGNRIKGGTFATGRVVSRVIGGALRLPTSAVRQSPENGQPFVYRIDGRVLDIAQVQLGVVDDRVGIAEVISGLKEGDRVVVGNVGTLGRGMQVQVVGGEAGRRGGTRAGDAGVRPPAQR